MTNMYLRNAVAFAALAAMLCSCSGSGAGVPTGANPSSANSQRVQRDSKRITITQLNDLPDGKYASYYPDAITTGPDGALWVADNIDPDFGTSAIVRIATSGKRTNTIYDGDGTADFRSIAAGSDGALWITDEGRILRMALDGKFKTFRLKNGAYALTIISGPDDALWFTADVGSDNAIGEITTQGTITLHGAPVGTQGITAGPDGAIWFTDAQSFIGRMTTQGKIKEYKNGITQGSQPYSIEPGPDGALWFTEEKGGRIGRITTKGKVTEYSTGISRREQPQDIAAGPDQAMWFTEYRPRGSTGASDSKIGRIATSGTIAEYSGFDSHSGPTGIVLGPDGNMWFLEFYANRIGRINI